MKVIQREWTTKGPLGKKVRHVAYGYTLMVNGKREKKYSSSWTSEEDALKALSARLERVKAGQIDRPLDVTFGQVVKRYLEYKAEHGKRTVSEDKRILEKEFTIAFGAGLPIRQLSAEKIARWEERRITQVSPNTVRNQMAVLRHMLRLACRKWEYLDRVPEIELPKAARGRTRYLDQGEIRQLLAACAKSKNKHLPVIVTLAIHTGMRRGEILNLKWERVQLDQDNLGTNARIVLYDTKNGEPRGVPLSTKAIAALASLEPDPTKMEGSVFRRKNGEDWGQIRGGFQKAVQRAGLLNFRFHDLRHTAASHLAMRGRPLREIGEILGHKSTGMTLRYAHLSPAHLRTAVESLDGLTPMLTLTPRIDDTAAPHHSMAHKMAQSIESDTKA